MERRPSQLHRHTTRKQTAKIESPRVLGSESGAFTYDANGNVTSAPAPYSISSVTYDPQNLPLSLTRNTTTTVYRYDDAEQRIAKQAGTQNAEAYVREGATTLGVFTVNASGTPTSFYFNIVWADRVVGRQTDAGTRTYYHTDVLGSTRAVTLSTTGAVVESYDFDPWGLLMPGRTLGSGTKEGFSGKEQDAETGLDYFGARYYMPALGRWTAVDPLVDKAPEWSSYVYTMDSPMSFVDPTGRQTEKYSGADAKEYFRGLLERARHRPRRPPTPLEMNPACQTGSDAVRCMSAAFEPIKKAEPLMRLVASLPTLGAGEALPASLELATPLVARAKAIQEAIGVARVGRTTTAVVQTVAEDGTTIRVVASSEGRLRAAQIAALEPGEVAAVGVRGVHAEVNGINFALAQGWRVTAVAASRPICGFCAELIQDIGAIVASALK